MAYKDTEPVNTDSGAVIIAQMLENDKINKMVDDTAALVTGLTKGKVVKWSATNSRWELCDGTATLAATDIIGIVEYIGSPDTSGQVRVGGVYTDDTLTANTAYYCQADGTLGATETRLFIGRCMAAGRLCMASRGSGGGGGGGGYRNLRGGNNSTTPNTKMDYTVDMATLEDSSSPPKSKQFFAVSITGIDLGAAGANGLDTGSKANSTEYWLWLIGKEDGTIAGLWSLSSTAPTLPAGYTYKWRCGWNHTDNSGNIYRVRQVDNVAQYVTTAATNTATYPALASGAVGDPSVPTRVATSVTGFIPSTAFRIIGIAAVMAPTFILMVAPNNVYGAYNSSNPAPVNIMAGGGQYLSEEFNFVLESTNIYVSQGANCIVRCMGWEDVI